MSSRRSNFAGFTLIELILVLLILTIVVGIAAPSLRGFGVGRRSNEVATQIISLSNWSRTQAISQGKTYRLNFDVPNRTFFVQVQDVATFQAAANEYGNTIGLPDGMSLRLERDALPASNNQNQGRSTSNRNQNQQQSDVTYVEFRPDGRCDPARIFLIDKQGGQIEIACPSATELFHILKPGEVDR